MFAAVRAVALCLLAALALAPISRVRAQETGHEPPSEAMTLFESAREHYRNGRYHEAAEQLERALMLDPSAPTLLYNLGRVYELMGEYDRAIEAFEHLQVVTPNATAEERAQTETTLGRLRGARERATPPPTVEEVGSMEEGPTFVRERGVADEAFWGVLAAGAVISLTAVGLAIGALVQDQQVDQWILASDRTIEDRAAAYDVAAGLALGADVLGGIGAATFAAAVVLFIARERSYEVWPSRTAGLSFDVGLGSVSGRWTW